MTAPFKQSVMFQILFCLNCSMLGTAFDRNTYSFGHCPIVGATDSDPNLAFHDRLSGAAFFCTSVLPAIAGVVVLHFVPASRSQTEFVCSLGSGWCRVLAHRSEAEFVCSLGSGWFRVLAIDLKQNSSVLWAVAGVVFLSIDLKQNWMCLWMPFSRQVQARAISFHIYYIHIFLLENSVQCNFCTV